MIESDLTDDLDTGLERCSIGELKLRRAILDKIIREAQADGDERWHEPARQQKIIDKVIIKKLADERDRRGIPQPDDVTINCQPLYLTGRCLK